MISPGVATAPVDSGLHQIGATFGTIVAGVTAGSYVFSVNQGTQGSPSTQHIPGVFGFAAADWTMPGKLTRVYSRLVYLSNATAAGVNMVAGISPVTHAGGAGATSFSHGTQADPKATITTPGASTALTTLSAGALPADGVYVPTLAPSGTVAANHLGRAYLTVFVGYE